MREIIEKWLSDNNNFVAVFENKAFDSAAFGERIALCFDIDDWNRMEVGETRAPDTNRVGWKYILIGKSRDIEEVLNLFERAEVKDGAGTSG